MFRVSYVVEFPVTPPSLHPLHNSPRQVPSPRAPPTHTDIWLSFSSLVFTLLCFPLAVCCFPLVSHRYSRTTLCVSVVSNFTPTPQFCFVFFSFLKITSVRAFHLAFIEEKRNTTHKVHGCSGGEGEVEADDLQRRPLMDQPKKGGLHIVQ